MRRLSYAEGGRPRAVAHARLRAAPWWRLGGWRREALLFALVYLAYQGTRGLSRGSDAGALADAHRVVGAERALGLNVEGAIQRAFLGTPLLTALDWIYLAAQSAALAVGVVFVYRASRAVYRVLRTTLLTTWMLALPVYALFPTAPPRLARLGLADTVSAHTPIRLGSGSTTLLYNPSTRPSPASTSGICDRIGMAVDRSTPGRRHADRRAGLGPRGAGGPWPPPTSFLIDVAAGLILDRGGPRREPDRSPEREPSSMVRSSWRRRSGSASTSISTILPPATVKPKTASGRPRGATTTPAAPFTSAGRANRARRAKRSACSATAAAPRTSLDAPDGSGAAVGAEHDVRVEHREQRVEVAAARGGEEGVDDLPLAGEIGVGHRWPRPAPGGARGWRAAGPRSGSAPRSERSRRRARRTCRAARTRAARREPASRARRAARGRPSRPAALRARGRSRPRGSRSGRARARPADSSRRDLRERSMSRHTRATTVVSQPPRFSTPLGVGAAEPEPGLLHGVVRLAQRAEHPVGHRPQVGAVGLEPLRQPVVFVHRSHSSVAFRHSSDGRNPADVTARSSVTSSPRRPSSG